MKNRSSKKEVPFFARYLVGQHLRRVTASGHFVTLKYPSDDDEEWAVTLKYPSDDDEGEVVTMKYPSDGDDGEVE